MKLFPPFKSQEIPIANYSKFMESLSVHVMGHENADEDKIKYIGKLKERSFLLRTSGTKESVFASYFSGKINESLTTLSIGFDIDITGKIFYALVVLIHIFYLFRNYTSSGTLGFDFLVIIWMPLGVYIVGLILHQIHIKKMQKEMNYIIELCHANFTFQ